MSQLQFHSAQSGLKTLLARNRVPQNCKVCGRAPINKVGNVDFNWVSSNPPPFPPSGLFVTYWQCQTCGFAWAPVFDDWDDGKFAKHIYNAEIEKVEPLASAVKRTKNILERLLNWFKGYPSETRFLDYGCGPGILVKELETLGFKASGYDRFKNQFSSRPEGKFDIVMAFEVMEHINDIQSTIDDMLSFLAPNGLMVFGTFLAEMPMNIDWWYCSPRSGHISFWTVPALEATFRRKKLSVASDYKTFHFVYPAQIKYKIDKLLVAGF